MLNLIFLIAMALGSDYSTMMSPPNVSNTNLKVPPNASYFYVTDSYFMRQTPAESFWFFPGVAYQSQQFSPGQDVDVYITSISVGTVSLWSSPQALNSDLLMAAYCVDNNKAVPIGTLRFSNPYNSSGQGLIGNSSSNGTVTLPQNINFGDKAAMKLSFHVPDGGCSHWMIGSAFEFHTAKGVSFEYVYHIHGATVAR